MLIRRFAWAVLVLSISLGFSATPTFAQFADSLSSEARVSVLTANPGQAVYSLWGHSALRVTDPVQGFDAVFNWGTFDVDQPYFVPRFAYGAMQYELSLEPMTRFMRGYAAEQRGVVEQEIALTQEARQQLWGLLLENLKPENRAYAYDFVRDNCSTRILDLLIAVDAIELPEPATDSEPTYRQVVDSYLHQVGWVDLGIGLAFGYPMDRDISPEDKAFLPLDFMHFLDAAGSTESGPLVSEKRTLLDIPWVPAPPRFDRVQWLFWVIAILILVFTARSIRSNKLSGPQSIDRAFLTVFGLAGVLLFAMWMGTLHWVTGWNADLLWALPTHLVMAIWWKRASWLGTYFRASSILMIVTLVVQLLFLQSMPIAMTPLVAALAWRFWVVGGSSATQEAG